MLEPAKTFRTPGKVSVWIGNLDRPDQLDEYMNLTRSFENDFGFALDDRDVLEATVELNQKPIPELVNGFSACHSFAENVVKAAKAAGTEQATTMLIYYAFEFDPSKTTVNPNARLRYLGAFSFSE